VSDAPKSDPVVALYRDWVRQTLFRYRAAPGQDPDQQLRTHLETGYAEAKSALAKMRAEDAPASHIQGQEIAVFVFAAGLFTYGKVDVAEEIVDYIPPAANIRKLARVLDALLPLPENISVLDHPDAVRAWLQAHRDQLRWEEELGRYMTAGP
jgi:hypothetical protein